MATLDTVSSAEITASKVERTKIETALWKARRALWWWVGRDINNKEYERMVLEVLALMTVTEPQNAGTTHDMARQLGAPEPVVRKIVDFLLTKGIEYIDARKAEGGE
jgi:hypothetical protein